MTDICIIVLHRNITIAKCAALAKSVLFPSSVSILVQATAAETVSTPCSAPYLPLRDNDLWLEGGVGLGYRISCV